jgi:hypothetical protein
MRAHRPAFAAAGSARGFAVVAGTAPALMMAGMVRVAEVRFALVRREFPVEAGIGSPP